MGRVCFPSFFPLAVCFVFFVCSFYMPYNVVYIPYMLCLVQCVVSGLQAVLDVSKVDVFQV
jgi:hypothetical protein